MVLPHARRARRHAQPRRALSAIKPAIPAAIVYAITRNPNVASVVRARDAFLLVVVETNTATGRLAEEYATDGVIRSGRQLSRRVLPGVGSYLLELFAELIDLLERAIYRVDEWLRLGAGPVAS